MTVKKARKILGKSASKLTDDEIQQAINYFSQIIDIGFQLFEKKYAKNGFDKAKQACP